MPVVALYCDHVGEIGVLAGFWVVGEDFVLLVCVSGFCWKCFPEIFFTPEKYFPDFFPADKIFPGFFAGI